MNKPTKQHYTWAQFLKDTEAIEKHIGKNGLHFKNIYGVPRGGLILGTLLSYRLGVPLILDASKITSHTLVVDDMSDTGGTLVRLLKKYKKPAAIMTLWSTPETKIIPDFFVRTKTSEWIVLPWETENSSKYDKTSF